MLNSSTDNSTFSLRILTISGKKVYYVFSPFSLEKLLEHATESLGFTKASVKIKVNNSFVVLAGLIEKKKGNNNDDNKGSEHNTNVNIISVVPSKATLLLRPQVNSKNKSDGVNIIFNSTGLFIYFNENSVKKEKNNIFLGDLIVIGIPEKYNKNTLPKKITDDVDEFMEKKQQHHFNDTSSMSSGTSANTSISHSSCNNNNNNKESDEDNHSFLLASELTIQGGGRSPSVSVDAELSDFCISPSENGANNAIMNNSSTSKTKNDANVKKKNHIRNKSKTMIIKKKHPQLSSPSKDFLVPSPSELEEEWVRYIFRKERGSTETGSPSNKVNNISANNGIYNNNSNNSNSNNNNIMYAKGHSCGGNEHIFFDVDEEECILDDVSKAIRGAAGSNNPFLHGIEYNNNIDKGPLPYPHCPLGLHLLQQHCKENLIFPYDFPYQLYAHPTMQKIVEYIQTGNIAQRTKGTKTNNNNNNNNNAYCLSKVAANFIHHYDNDDYDDDRQDWCTCADNNKKENKDKIDTKSNSDIIPCTNCRIYSILSQIRSATPFLFHWIKRHPLLFLKIIKREIPQNVSLQDGTFLSYQANALLIASIAAFGLNSEDDVLMNYNNDYLYSEERKLETEHSIMMMYHMNVSDETEEEMNIRKWELVEMENAVKPKYTQDYSLFPVSNDNGSHLEEDYFFDPSEKSAENQPAPKIRRKWPFPLPNSTAVACKVRTSIHRNESSPTTSNNNNDNKKLVANRATASDNKYIVNKLSASLLPHSFDPASYYELLEVHVTSLLDGQRNLLDASYREWLYNDVLLTYGGENGSSDINNDNDSDDDDDSSYRINGTTEKRIGGHGTRDAEILRVRTNNNTVTLALSPYILKKYMLSFIEASEGLLPHYLNFISMFMRMLLAPLFNERHFFHYRLFIWFAKRSTMEIGNMSCEIIWQRQLLECWVEGLRRAIREEASGMSLLFSKNSELDSRNSANMDLLFSVAERTEKQIEALSYVQLALSICQNFLCCQYAYLKYKRSRCSSQGKHNSQNSSPNTQNNNNSNNSDGFHQLGSNADSFFLASLNGFGGFIDTNSREVCERYFTYENGIHVLIHDIRLQVERKGVPLLFFSQQLSFPSFLNWNKAHVLPWKHGPTSVFLLVPSSMKKLHRRRREDVVKRSIFSTAITTTTTTFNNNSSNDGHNDSSISSRCSIAVKDVWDGACHYDRLVWLRKHVSSLTESTSRAQRENADAAIKEELSWGYERLINPFLRDGVCLPFAKREPLELFFGRTKFTAFHLAPAVLKEVLLAPPLAIVDNRYLYRTQLELYEAKWVKPPTQESPLFDCSLQEAAQGHVSKYSAEGSCIPFAAWYMPSKNLAYSFVPPSPRAPRRSVVSLSPFPSSVSSMAASAVTSMWSTCYAPTVWQWVSKSSVLLSDSELKDQDTTKKLIREKEAVGIYRTMVGDYALPSHIFSHDLLEKGMSPAEFRRLQVLLLRLNETRFFALLARNTTEWAHSAVQFAASVEEGPWELRAPLDVGEEKKTNHTGPKKKNSGNGMLNVSGELEGSLLLYMPFAKVKIATLELPFRRSHVSIIEVDTGRNTEGGKNTPFGQSPIVTGATNATSNTYLHSSEEESARPPSPVISPPQKGTRRPSLSSGHVEPPSTVDFSTSSRGSKRGAYGLGLDMLQRESINLQGAGKETIRLHRIYNPKTYKRSKSSLVYNQAELSRKRSSKFRETSMRWPSVPKVGGVYEQRMQKGARSGSKESPLDSHQQQRPDLTNSPEEGSTPDRTSNLINLTTNPLKRMSRSSGSQSVVPPMGSKVKMVRSLRQSQSAEKKRKSESEGVSLQLPPIVRQSPYCQVQRLSESSSVGYRQPARGSSSKSSGSRLNVPAVSSKNISPEAAGFRTPSLSHERNFPPHVSNPNSRHSTIDNSTGNIRGNHGTQEGSRRSHEELPTVHYVESVGQSIHHMEPLRKEEQRKSLEKRED